MGFFDKIKAGLAKTRAALSSTLDEVFDNADAIDEDFYDLALDGDWTFGKMQEYTKMVTTDMDAAEEAWPTSYLFAGHYDNSVDAYGRPHTWSEGQGHNAIERKGTPEGVVGNPKLATADKAKRPIAAILKYLTLVHDEILEKYPAGQLPPVDMITFRSKEELAPFLKEPLSEGWKSVHELPKIGIFDKF